MNTEQGAFTPVTEAEVMNFAQRIATSLVSYSKQAEELTAIKAQLEQVSADLRATHEDNKKLRDDINSATELASQAERERDLAKAEAMTWQSKATHLQDVMIGRDATVSELRMELNTANDKLVEVVKERDRLESEVINLRNSADHWRRSSGSEAEGRKKAEVELRTCQTTLNEIRSAYEKIFAAFSPEPKTEIPLGYSQQPEELKGVPSAPAPEKKPEDDMPF